MSETRRSTPLARSCEVPHTCPRPLRHDVLAHAPYFTSLGPDEISAIDARMQVQGYDEGEVLYQAGAPATHLFILATGRVKVLRPALDAADALVDVITPGAMFGTVAPLGDSAYPDTAEALTVSCALRITAADFRQVLNEHPRVAMAVLDDVAIRLDQAHQTVRTLSGGTVEQRVATTLLTLAEKFGEQRAEGLLLQLPLSRADLAAMTGTTTESASRSLSRLSERGLIETGRRWTAIRDTDGLARVATGQPAD